MSKKEGSPGQKRQWKFKMQKNNDSPFVSIIIVSSVSFAGWLLVERIPGHVRNWGSRGARGEEVQQSVHSATAGEEHSVQGEGRVKINGCIAGSFKKRGLVRMLLIIFQRVSQSVIC